jgi:SRSO17 transposase
LILDDTGVPKKGTHTEGVKRQYIGQLGKVTNGQVFVTSHYADEHCHWPVEILPYVPDNWLEGGKENPNFRTKAQLALQLVDQAVEFGLSFRAVIVDCWFARIPSFVKGLEERELPFVMELEASQRIFARLPGDIASNEHRLKEALRLLAPEDFRPVRLKNADGTEREVYVAALKVKIKKLHGRRRVVVVTTRPDDPTADEELRFLTTNIVQLRHDTVARLYALRNWVEVFYREAKDDLGSGQYQVRDLESILRHWYLVFVAYSLLVRLRREGQLARWCKKNCTPCVRP